MMTKNRQKANISFLFRCLFLSFTILRLRSLQWFPTCLGIVIAFSTSQAGQR